MILSTSVYSFMMTAKAYTPRCFKPALTVIGVCRACAKGQRNLVGGSTFAAMRRPEPRSNSLFRVTLPFGPRPTTGRSGSARECIIYDLDMSTLTKDFGGLADLIQPSDVRADFGYPRHVQPRCDLTGGHLERDVSMSRALLRDPL